MSLGGYWQGLSATGSLDSLSDTSRFMTRAIPMVLLPTLVGLEPVCLTTTLPKNITARFTRSINSGSAEV